MCSSDLIFRMVIQKKDTNRLFLHNFDDPASGFDFLNVGHFVSVVT